MDFNFWKCFKECCEDIKALMSSGTVPVAGPQTCVSTGVVPTDATTLSANGCTAMADLDALVACLEGEGYAVELGTQSQVPGAVVWEENFDTDNAGWELVDDNGAKPAGHSSTDFATFVGMAGPSPSGGGYLADVDRVANLTDYRSPSLGGIDVSAAAQICWDWVNFRTSDGAGGSASLAIPVTLTNTAGATWSANATHGNGSQWETLCVDLSGAPAAILEDLDQITMNIETVSSAVGNEHFGIDGVRFIEAPVASTEITITGETGIPAITYSGGSAALGVSCSRPGVYLANGGYGCYCWTDGDGVRQKFSGAAMYDTGGSFVGWQVQSGMAPPDATTLVCACEDATVASTVTGTTDDPDNPGTEIAAYWHVMSDGTVTGPHLARDLPGFVSACVGC